MPRPKSKHGNVRKVYLRYREGDPRYGVLDTLIARVPAGSRNARLLDALLDGLGADAPGGKSVRHAGMMDRNGLSDTQVTSPITASVEPTKPSDPGRSHEYSHGAASLFTQF